MLRLTHRLITKDESESAASYRMSQEYRDFMFRKLVSNAANLGNWDTLKFLSSSTYFQWCRFRPCTVRDIAYAGRLDILKWLAAYRSDVVLTSLDVTKAIKGGHFDVAKELVATVAMRPEGSVEIWMEAAAAMGGFDLLKWFCSQYEGSIPESALLHAVSNGHLTIVKWIIDQNCIDVQSELFRFWLGNAVSHGHLDTVKWIIRRYPTKCGFTVNTHWGAIEQGTVETMKLLWTANPEPYSPRMIEVAAARGDLDIVKWLCEHKTNKPLGNLIDAAAEGRLP
ncbi:unnamed protein product [Phytophthora lilii]|uniref:Unnamed protein product n=1 Tax=Phytophthora lilii TaxID=2077276 RepID=A0A9W6WP43_9STRA|nr:unnamed protein product [Phytophthora lilii]